MTDRVTQHQYHPLVDEIIASGVDEDSAHRLVLASIAAYQFGNTVPWFKASRAIIEREQGSKIENVGFIARLATTRLDEMDEFAATKWAGDEWRKMIRPQYDYRADHGFHVSIDGMVEEREHLGFDHAEDMVTVALHHHYDPIDTLFEYDEHDDRIDAVYAAVEDLTELQRNVFTLRIESSLSWADIAQELGLGTRQQASSAYKRAVEKLQAVLT